MIKRKVSLKDKKKYEITAPEMFDSQLIGTTFATEEEKVIGRTVELPLSRLTGDKSKQKIKIKFRVNKVEGNKARTEFKEFYLNPKYIRSKVKKGREKIESVSNLDLSDCKVWVKVIIMTHYSTQTSKNKVISSKATKTLKEFEESDLNDFLQEALFGKLGTQIYHKVKKITPIKRVEIEKVKIP